MTAVFDMLPAPLRRLFRWGVISLVIAFWGMYIWRNWDQMVSHRWQLDFSWLALSFVVVLVFWLTLPFIWQRALISSGGSLKLGAAYRLWAMSMIARYLPGGMWHIASRVYMAEGAGESRGLVFISTIMEQVLSLMSTLLLLLLSLPFWDANYAGLKWVLLLVLPLAVAVHPAVLRPLGTLAIRMAGRKKGGKDAAALASEPFIPPGYGSLLALIAMYMLANILAGLSLFLSAAAVGPVSLHQFPAFEGAFSIGWIVGFFAFFAPSGLGVREGAIALLLTPIVGAPVAVAASVLNRVVFSLGEAVFVAGCWGMTRGKRGKGKEGKMGVASPLSLLDKGDG